MSLFLSEAYVEVDASFESGAIHISEEPAFRMTTSLHPYPFGTAACAIMQSLTKIPRLFSLVPPVAEALDKLRLVPRVS